MDILDCIRKMIEASGKSARQVSRDLGRSPNYLGATFAHGSDVGASNAARIARLLGWRLAFVRDDGDYREELEVTPRANSNQGTAD
jgi:hypothetical protein